MAQTTVYFGPVSGSPRIEYNTSGGSTYTDASGEIVSLTWAAGERSVPEVNTLDGDFAIITPGKVAATEFTIRGVYTGSSSGFWKDLESAYQGGTAMYFRVYPAGSSSGRWRWVSGTTAVAASAGSANSGWCYVQNRPVPNMDAADSAVFTYEATMKAVTFTAGSI